MADLRTVLIVMLTFANGVLLLAGSMPAASKPVTSAYTEPAAARVYALSTIRSSLGPRGRPTAIGEIDGVEIRFIIDTGSTHTVLTRQDAVRSGVNASASIQVETAGGLAVFQQGPQTRIRLNDGENMAETPVLVSDEISISLLGVDALKDAGIEAVSIGSQ